MPLLKIALLQGMWNIADHPMALSERNCVVRVKNSPVDRRRQKKWQNQTW
jgi:hypothetical protein